MERSFYNEDFDFEELIRHKSDQYKIYPSDKVWRGIHNSIHPTRKWYWLGLVLFLGGFSYYAIEQLSTPQHTNHSSQQKKKEPVAATTEAVILPFTPPTSVVQKRKVDRNTYRQKGLVIAMSESQTENSDLSPIPLAVIADAKLNRSAETEINVANNEKLAQQEKNFVLSAISNIHQQEFESLLNDKANVAEKLAEEKLNPAPEEKIGYNEITDARRINWLQENAVYELTRPKLKRVSWQLIASPTMNYRKLVGNRDASIASDSKNIPIALNIEGDVDKLANHRPALGFELGSMLMYAINKKVTFKTGVQFNFSRYNIQAYSSTFEKATIALTNFYSPSTDSITTYTSIRNFGGKAEKDLENKYYELSTPIGVDVLVIGRGRLQFSVGGTIQPTYLINRDNYMITTDYKNYTHEPSLVRRWNVNTSAEAFLSYKAGGFKVQLGPQFRYQLFSTYSDKYPIKEFLMEYGVKLGVSKTLK